MITELPQEQGNGLVKSRAKPCVHPDPGEGAATPQVTEPDFPASVWESQRRRGQPVACAGSGALDASHESRRRLA